MSENHMKSTGRVRVAAITLIIIRDMFVSSLGRDIGYTESFPAVFLFPPSKWVNSAFMSSQIPSKYLHSIFISFHVISN